VASAFIFLRKHTNNAYAVYYTQQHCNLGSPLKPYTLAGFEPVFSDPVMAIAPRRPGLIFFIFIRTFITFISRLAAG
jgi:hypothetical protein